MMLAYSADKVDKSVTLKCSDGRELTTDKWDDIAEFILMPTEKDMAVVWHLDTFVNNIISILPPHVSDKVQLGGRVYSPDNRKLYYQMGRVFGINHINLYGLSRYSDERIDDVAELARLGDRVLDAYRAFGIEANKLSSPVAVYGGVLEALNFPRACDLPDDAFNLLQKCSEKEWVEWREIFRVGHWQADEIVDFDIQSAYPSLIANLPDLYSAKFFESDTMPGEKDYSWGELEGILRITKDVTPFLNVGEWSGQITSEHLWLINKYGLGTFEMKHGWFFKLPQYYKLPFKKTMHTLYQARQNDNPLVKAIAKGIAVGIGGRFAQRYEDGKLGLEYNSIYSRLITSRCQIKVADFIWRHGLQDSIVSVLVDGFLAEGKGLVDNIHLVNNGMGSWRVNPPTPFLVVNLLYQWGSGKKPNGQNYVEVIDSIESNLDNPIVGKDVDLNLLEFQRDFEKLPKSGRELLGGKYYSTPQIIK